MEEFVAQPCTTDRYFLGECCRWDDVREELYWVNVDAGQFFRATAEHTKIQVIQSYKVDGYLTALAPMLDRDQGWIIASNQSVSLLGLDGALRELARPEAHNAAEVRTNDGAADPWGRFWIGSMAFDAGSGRGSLYRFHESTGVEKVLGDVTISNGLGWSSDRRTMYYVDSGPGTIHTFDVNDRGEISNKRLFAQFDTATEGTPDGLCVDAEGAIWVAVWGGYEVRRYAASGEQIATVSVSTAQPSCCAIGGANGTTLYITTAQEDLAPATLEREPDAGRLYCVDVAVTGRPLDPYRPTLG